MRLLPILLLAALLAPTALADHAFSHRLYVVGRIVDATDAPVPGKPVEVTFVGIEDGGKCFDSRDESTDPRGDFAICRHLHVIPRGAVARIKVADQTFEVEIDRDVRQATLHGVLSVASPPYDLTGWREFNTTFHVQGRVYEMLAEPTEVENVRVPATVRAGENVTVTLEHEGAQLARAVATVDAMGFYKVDLDVDEVPAGAVVNVAADGGIRSSAVESSFRRADVHHVLSLPEEESEPIARPGTAETPIAGWVPVLALILAFATTRWRR